MTNVANILMARVHDVYPSTEISNVSYNITTNTYSDRCNATTDSTSVTKNLMVPSVMFFLGVFGNLTALIILTVRPSRDSKSTAFYHLVKALVCMDLFGIIASSPVTIVVYIKRGGVIQTGGMPLCHYFSFILVMAGNATVFTVLVMAAERYMVSKYPFKYSRVVKPLTVNCCILVVWGLSTLTALLPIFGMGRNIEPWPGTWCFFDYRSKTIDGKIFSYYYATSGLLAIVITITLNYIVTRHLWRMRRSRLSSSSLRSPNHYTPSHDRQNPDSEKRMVIFLIAITLVFTLCYAPLMVRVIMNQMLNVDLTLSGGYDDTIDLWALRLACLNQILDPWVYIISRVTCCKSSRDSDRNDMSHSTRSYRGVSFIYVKDNHHIIGPQAARTKDKTFQNVRHIFSRKRLSSDEKEPVTMPLQPTLTQKLMTSSVQNGSKSYKLKEVICT